MHQTPHTPLDFYLDEAGLRTVSEQIGQHRQHLAQMREQRTAREITRAILSLAQADAREPQMVIR